MAWTWKETADQKAKDTIRYDLWIKNTQVIMLQEAVLKNYATSSSSTRKPQKALQSPEMCEARLDPVLCRTHEALKRKMDFQWEIYGNGEACEESPTFISQREWFRRRTRTFMPQDSLEELSRGLGSACSNLLPWLEYVEGENHCPQRHASKTARDGRPHGTFGKKRFSRYTVNSRCGACGSSPISSFVFPAGVSRCRAIS